MKKLALLLSMLMVLGLALVACGGSTPPADSGSGSTSVAEGGDDSDGGEEEVFFDPSLLQIRAVDDLNFEVTLPVETPYFLELAAFPTFSPVPMHILNDVGEAWATDAATYIGNGAYQVTEWVTGSHILMEKNPNYWDAESIGPAKIRFMLIEDSTARFNAFQADELDFMIRPPVDEMPTYENDPGYGVFTQLGTYYVSMNNQEAPFDDVNVRKAFALAIDRDHIANVICNGSYVPADAWVAPSLKDVEAASFRDVGPSYWDPSAEAYDANLEEAKAALAEAGYPDGEGFPVVTYIYNEDAPHPQVAQALQDMWGALGVTVELEIQEWSTFLNSRKNGEYQLARDGWLCDYNDPMSMLDMFISSSGNNNSQLRSPEYDALVTELKATGDNTRRFEIMHELEDMLMNDWVFAPIMYYSETYLSDPELLNSMWNSPLGYQYLMFADGYDDGEMVVCIGPDPDTIDPALNSAVDGATMIIHTFEGLYRLNKDGDPEPALAESVEVSDDGLTYTFKLREGLQWSDGEPINAQTFVDSWTRAIDPATAADYAYLYEVVAGYNEALGGEG